MTISLTKSPKPLAEDLQQAIAQKLKQDAHDAFRQGLAGDPEIFVQLLRSKGGFRFSNYAVETATIFSLVDEALDVGSQKLSTQSMEYLRSVRALGFIADEVRATLKRIKRGINARSFKTYVATVDNLFLNNHTREQGVPRSDWRHFAKEELASAFSYYYVLLNEKEKPTPSDLRFIVEHKSTTPYYLEVLSDLAKIVSFKEAEFLVEVFGYKANRNGAVIEILPADHQFEMSVRWGYIYFEVQQQADAHRSRLPEMASLVEAATMFASELADSLFEIKHAPVERIVMKLPLIEPFIEIINADALHFEEWIAMDLIEKTLLISRADIRQTPIYKSITVFDLVKFQRFWTFLMSAFQDYCKRQQLVSKPIYFRSLVPLYDYQSVRAGIGAFFGEQKTGELFELLTWDLSKGKVFDIQCTPILKVGEVFAIPIGIMATSALPRNVLQSTRFRFDASSDVDPVGDMLSATLLAAGLSPSRNVPYSHGGTQGEVDVLAVSGEKLFAFECKNSLHPCSPFELRQSYDYLCKAFQQLSRFRHFLSDPTFVQMLGAKLHRDLSGIKSLTTCVVMGNRMFSGYRHDGHAVRSLYELCNLILTGVVTMTVFDSRAVGLERSGVMRKRFWQGNSFHPGDLENYLQKDSIHQCAFGAMREFDDTIRFQGRQLRFKTFQIDLATWFQAFSRLPGVEFIDGEANPQR